MKTYFENPQIEVKKFSVMEDILTVSGDDDNAMGEDEF